MLKEPKFEAVRINPDNRDEEILSGFTVEERAEIENKRKILSSLAFFIGKDFEIPVELNEPGKGWHWNFKNNIIRIDPKDLLEKPMDYLRFVISHEGGHRRISRTDFIPKEVWQEPGFSFLMNSIEDPRDNNFVAHAYPKFREQMESAYRDDMDIEGKSIEKAKQKLGYQPRFMQAGFEYIKQWYRDTHDDGIAVTQELPEEVRTVVEKTVEAARDSWWKYPSKEEADASEDTISKYAEASYKINLKKVWPEFKKLIEKDQEDQKMQEFLKDMEVELGEKQSGEHGTPDSLKDKLTDQEKKELEEAIKKALEDVKESKNNQDSENDESQPNEKSDEDKDGDSISGETSSDVKTIADKMAGKPSSTKAPDGKPIELDSLSDELKQKIKEYIEGLSDDKKKELAEKAGKAIKDFEDEINKDLKGKFSDESGESEPKKDKDVEGDKKVEVENDTSDKNVAVDFSKKDQEEFRKNLENIFIEAKNDPYNKALKQIAPLIDNLAGDLRDVFIKRKQESNEAEYRSGKRWNVKKRIKEISSGIPLFKSEAREQKNSESEEKDYALTLLIDLSGSMRQNGKINEAFKSTILLAEVLHDLDIKFEIVGFQDCLIEFKKFE